MNGLPVSVRASAVSLAVSGFIVAATTPWHPSIFDRPVDDVLLESVAWSPLHAIGVLVFILALIGVAGLVAAHHGRLGSPGTVELIAGRAHG